MSRKVKAVVERREGGARVSRSSEEIVLTAPTRVVDGEGRKRVILYVERADGEVLEIPVAAILAELEDPKVSTPLRVSAVNLETWLPENGTSPH